LFETIWEQMMNERIRELADKIWEEKYWTNPNTDKLLPAQLNRFAELIVRECLSIVDDAERGGSNEVWDNAVKFIRRDLKEHFGVEE
jgi:hypothetical protein